MKIQVTKEDIEQGKPCEGAEQEFPLPSEVSQFISNFDFVQSRSRCKPFSFELDLDLP